MNVKNWNQRNVSIIRKSACTHSVLKSGEQIDFLYCYYSIKEDLAEASFMLVIFNWQWMDWNEDLNNIKMQRLLLK